MPNSGASGSLRSVRSPDHVEVRPVASRDEAEEAYRLVYHSYLKRQYIEPDDHELRLSAFSALPDSVTFVGTLAGRVISTISLVPDTSLGLPMEEIYSAEVGQLRERGRRPTEVTMLADRRLELRRTLPMLLSLMKLVFDYASLVLKATDLCITVNPRHSKFYQRYLLFEALGDLRLYPAVRNNPAVAKRLDLETVRQRCERNELLLHLFFENRTPPETFNERYRMDCDALRYFFMELTPVFKNLEPETLDSLEAFHRACAWEEWRGTFAKERGALNSRSARNAGA